jgi:general secretion pathway protein D
MVNLIAGCVISISSADDTPPPPLARSIRSAETSAAIPAQHNNDNAVTKTKQAPEQMWNLQDADIHAVIQTISQLTGKNFIIDPRVQGKITIISSRPMSVNELYQVFLSMLQVLNYAAIPAGDITKIVPMVQAKEYGGALSSRSHPGSGDEVVVQIVPVDNISASQLVPVLRPLLQEWGSLTAYDPANTLILAGSANSVNRLVDIIHTMDQKNASAIQVVHLKYANAKKLVDVLTSLQASDRSEGKVNNISFAADEENNAILLSGNGGQRNQMKRLIHQLDTRTSNGSANTVVLKLSYLNAKKLAPILTKIARGKLAQQNRQRSNGVEGNRFGIGGGDTNASDAGISIQSEDDDNAVVINAPTAMIQTLRQVVRQLDVRPGQVLVQALIVRVDESVLEQLGIQWGTTTPNANPSSLNVANFPAGIGFIPNGNLQVLIQMLTTNTSTDVLATPAVVVLNNKPATISDGKNVGIINRQYEGTSAPISDNSTLPFNTFERYDVTLQLKVTPQITPNNTVRLTIDQQDNRLEPDTSSTPDNPTIDTSKIKTNVLVNSGDILVLGGLISNDSEEHKNKIPFLGDIPLLGHLFRYTNRSAEKKNLMVFIRPVILHNRYQGNAETRKRYDYIRFQEFRKKADLGLDVTDAPMLPDINNGTKPAQLPPPFDP